MASEKFPIDFVFLWCSGSDPKFARQKNTRMRQSTPALIDDNIGDIRYIQHDELRFALRSVYRYAPWARHIFLVTNHQRPSWLADYPTISIVDHTEFIPANILPTFSSIGIEMYLDRIPGLSEHFIYANDDTMLNRSLEQRDFFSEEGKPMVWMYKPSRKSFTPKNGGDILGNHVITDWEQTLVRAWGLYREKNGYSIPFYTPAHSFDAYTKTLFRKILQKYPELYVCNAAPFRTGNEISRVLFSYEMINTFGCPCVFRPKITLWAMLKELFASVEMVAVSRNAANQKEVKKVIRDIRIFNPKTVCFNNLTDNSADEAIAYLKRRFPVPAPWEKL